MTGVLETVLGRLAAEAASPIVKRFRRNLARRGVGPADLFILQDRTSGPQKGVHWPISLLEKLPPDVNQKQIDMVIQTAELQLFARQLISLYLISDDHRIQKKIAQQVDALLKEHLKSAYPDRLDEYTSAFFRHFAAACKAVASKMKEDADVPAEVIQAASNGVANEVMLSIDGYFELIAAESQRKYSKVWISKYLDVFMKEHGRIELPDLARRRQIPYDELFVSPEIIALDNASLIPKTHAGKTGQEPSKQSLNELQADLDRIVILGDPGAGKSTTSSIIGVQDASEPNSLPFIIALRQVKSPNFSLPSLLANSLRTRYQIANVTPESVDRALHERRTLLIFDGLDEILTNSQRSDFARTIEAIARSYAYARIVVTCRRVGYLIAQLDSNEFSTYQIGQFNKEQIAEYARKWFHLQEHWQGWSPEEFVSEFLRSAMKMLDLVRNPLLLAFVCVLYRGRRAIPRGRYMLYRKCVELLLGEWDQARGIIEEAPDSDQLQESLARIASVFGRIDVTSQRILADLVPYLTEKVFGSESEARKYAKGLLALCRGRAWLFTDFGVDENDDDIFAFTHNSFYEYFLALHTVRSARSGPELAEKLERYILTGQSEVYTQICLSLHQQAAEEGASDVLTMSIERLETQYPIQSRDNMTRIRGLDQNANQAARRLAAKSISELGDIVPLSRNALSRISRLALAQIAEGDVVPALTILSQAYRHKVAMHEVIVQDLLGSLRGVTEVSDLRLIWFALHAGYLRRVGFDESIVPEKYIIELRDSIAPLRSELRTVASKSGVFEWALSFYGGAIDDGGFGAGDIRKACNWTFEQHWQPVYGLGPKSLATWVFDAFQSDDRKSMNVAGSAKFLRAAAKHINEFGEIPDDLALPKTAVDPHVFPQRIEAALPRVLTYPEEVRSGFAYISMMALSMTILGDPLLTADAETALMQLPLGRVAADIREKWHAETSSIWHPPEGTVAS